MRKWLIVLLVFSISPSSVFAVTLGANNGQSGFNASTHLFNAPTITYTGTGSDYDGVFGAGYVIPTLTVSGVPTDYYFAIWTAFPGAGTYTMTIRDAVSCTGNIFGSATGSYTDGQDITIHAVITGGVNMVVGTQYYFCLASASHSGQPVAYKLAGSDYPLGVLAGTASVPILTFPLPNMTPYDAPVYAILDHSIDSRTRKPWVLRSKRDHRGLRWRSCVWDRWGRSESLLL